jgi:hypothetical protein
MGKKTSKKPASAKQSTDSETPAAKRAIIAGKLERPFPRASISEAIRIPLSLKEYNGGNPWPPSEIRRVVDASIGNAWVKSNQFYYLTTASRDFGFTEGTVNTNLVALSELGKSFAYAGSKDIELDALRSAFFKVEIFSKVFTHYGSGTLPEKKYVTNTLESTFGLDPDLHDEFLALFRENVQFLQMKEGGERTTPLSAGATGFGSSPPSKILSPAPGSDLLVVAEPEGGSKLTLFVAIPFGEKTDQFPKGFFQEVLSALIGPAGAAAGFRVVTANRTGTDVIQSTIVNGVLDSDLVLVDLTEHNPNVLFELGLRMAADKPVALVRAGGTGKIFDVDNMLRVFDYSKNLWSSSLSGDLPNLTAHIRASWDRRNSERTYMKILRGSLAEPAH